MRQQAFQKQIKRSINDDEKNMPNFIQCEFESFDFTLCQTAQTACHINTNSNLEVWSIVDIFFVHWSSSKYAQFAVTSKANIYPAKCPFDWLWSALSIEGHHIQMHMNHICHNIYTNRSNIRYHRVKQIMCLPIILFRQGQHFLESPSLPQAPSLAASVPLPALLWLALSLSCKTQLNQTFFLLWPFLHIFIKPLIIFILWIIPKIGSLLESTIQDLNNKHNIRHQISLLTVTITLWIPDILHTISQMFTPSRNLLHLPYPCSFIESLFLENLHQPIPRLQVSDITKLTVRSYCAY